MIKKLRQVPLIFTPAIGLLLFLFLTSCDQPKKKVLVFHKHVSYYHESIPAGVAAIQKLSKEMDLGVDTTTNASFFNEKTLKNYAAIIFLNNADNTGTLLNPEQEKAFEKYIKSGGGFVGIHAASDAEYEWEWYGKLVGGYFTNHPEIQPALLYVTDTSHVAVKHLPRPWKVKEEWYNFKNLNKDVNVLLTIDEKSYKGGENGDYHPISWWHNYDGGRSFYTNLGHSAETYSDPLFLKHLKGGLQYAINAR